MKASIKHFESLLSSKELNAKLTRWALFLQQFSMKIVYCPGAKNENADGLSMDPIRRGRRSSRRGGRCQEES